MDWNLISQISNTIGALGTASSVFAGYRIYIKSQKDEYVKNVRMLLSKIESNCKRLNYLATHELLHDISFSVVYRDDVKSMLFHLINKLKEVDLKQYATEEERRKIIAENIPTITFPVTSSMTKEYLEIIESTNLELEKYRFDFPGLFKSINTVFLVFQSLHSVNRQAISDDKIWENLLIEIIFKEETPLEIDLFEYKLHYYMVAGLLYRFNKQKDQNDINDMLEIMQLVTNSYRTLNDNNLHKQAVKESKIQLKPNSDLNNSWYEYFHEAEKALKTVLTTDELLKYREKVTSYSDRIKALNEKK